MYRKLLSLVLIFMAISLQAQPSLSGTVLDSKTGEPLIGVKVTHIPSGKEVLTDFDGQFRFEDIDEGVRRLREGLSGL